jgi:caspase domain-containing protein
MSCRAICLAAAVAATTWLGAGSALAESRIALVIGNSAYQSVSPLANPANDARAMGELLTAAGFEVVAAPDLTQESMRRAIGDFAGKVAAKGRDTVALVYYAGHGVQVDGENFLVPVDAHVEREADVPLQAVRLADLMNALAAVPSKTRIVLLDACRDNPFSEINKTSGKGLAIVDAPAGSLVSYATAPGGTAEDGTGADSPYTGSLTKIARQPGLPLEQALKRVRLAVHQTTDGRQTPWESSSLTSDFVFFPGAGGAQADHGATRPTGGTVAGARRDARSVDQWRRELQTLAPREAYEIVIREDVVEGYEALIALFPQQPFVSRVRSLFDRRSEMSDWYIAVTLDTIAAYQEFLSKHPNSDFAATARRLMLRSATRSLIEASRNPSRLANVATPTAGPTCPCSTPGPSPERRGDAPPQGPGGPTFTSLPPLPTPLPPPVVVVPPPPIIPPVVVIPPGGRPDGRPDGYPPRHPGTGSTGSDPGKGTGGTNPDRTPPVATVPPKPPVVTTVPPKPPVVTVPPKPKPVVTAPPPRRTVSLPPRNPPSRVMGPPRPRFTSGPSPRFVRPGPGPGVRMMGPRFGGSPIR